MMRALFRALAVAATLTAGAACTAKPNRVPQHMMVLGVTLEHTTLKQAQDLLGAAEIRNNGGDAAANASAECYVGADGTILALISHGEMGGGTTITGYVLATSISLVDFAGCRGYVVPPDKKPTCSALSSLSRATATGGGLKLGLTAEQVRGLLGEPREAQPNSLLFVSDTPVRLFDGEREIPGEWTRGRSVRVELDGGKVVAIEANQVTVN